MTAVEVKVANDGVLKIPSGVALPPDARLAVLVFSPADQNPEEWSSISIAALAQQSGSFDFLKEEPEIYSDSDILPGRENPQFRK
jgi:hypothetical protein